MLAVKDVYCLGADPVKQKEMGLSCTGRLYDGNRKARRKIAEKQDAINFKRGTIRFSVSGSVSSTTSVQILFSDLSKILILIQCSKTFADSHNRSKNERTFCPETFGPPIFFIFGR